jgi:hypothetical protein
MVSARELVKRPVFWICLIIISAIAIYLSICVYLAVSEQQKYLKNLDQVKFKNKTINSSMKLQEKPYNLWKKSLNESADPCLNFYDFACGNYLGGKASENDYHITEITLLDEYLPYSNRCLNSEY